MHFLGIDWVGVNAENGRKLLLSFAFVAIVVIASRLLLLAGATLSPARRAGPARL